MKLTRISRLRHRVFRDFVWPNELHDFGTFNLVYGWNGSGKSTLASLFASIEKRAPLVEGEVELLFDDRKKVTGAELGAEELPQVRVFDHAFVEATLASTGTIAPIYFVGEESIEKQREVERLKGELAEVHTAIAAALGAKKAADERFEDHATAQAKLIKTVLTGAHSATYNNYDKRHFKRAAQATSEAAAAAAMLTEDAKAALHSQKNAQPKPLVDKVAAPLVDLDALAREVDALVGRSVVAQTLDELTANPRLAAWVHQGLALHSGEHASETCRFCHQPLAAARRASLEAHFNDAFAGYQRELAAAAGKLASTKQALAALRIPETVRFYDALAPEAHAASEAVVEALAATTAVVEALLARVEAKRANPFAPAPNAEPAALARPSLRDAFTALSAVVDKHNQTSAQFKASVEDACKKLEAAFVAEGYAEFARLDEGVKAAERAIAVERDRASALGGRIDALERAILEHRRPAEQLTEELRAYLGRDELRFEVKGTGYALTRSGQPVRHLSEGERTSIAFLYFLKSLEDKTFDLKSGIVVIDDPVSNLDANALFSAFGTMRERTKGAGQLFLFTHNFAFFRMVKSWFLQLPQQRSKYPVKRPGRFFLLRAQRHVDGTRTSQLGALDPLLREHESEYPYLFKRVLDEAQRTSVDALEQHYGLPNVARRLLETFLAFRLPEQTGEDLSRRVEVIAERHGFDPAKTLRILRLVSAQADGSPADPEHDLSLLVDTQPALVDLLDLMHAVDADHFEGLTKLLARQSTYDDPAPAPLPRDA